MALQDSFREADWPDCNGRAATGSSKSAAAFIQRLLQARPLRRRSSPSGTQVSLLEDGNKARGPFQGLRLTELSSNTSAAAMSNIFRHAALVPPQAAGLPRRPLSALERRYPPLTPGRFPASGGLSKRPCPVCLFDFSFGRTAGQSAFRAASLNSRPGTANRTGKDIANDLKKYGGTTVAPQLSEWASARKPPLKRRLRCSKVSVKVGDSRSSARSTATRPTAFASPPI